ncbi:PAS domain S-box protein [bacterium]|nr:PAS domain S-box protein [bacterium]
MVKKKILIVEDEIIIAEDISGMLKRLGYVIAGLVTTGEDAVRYAETARPDLVLMDIVLGRGIDGIEAAKTIFDRFEIPVVVITAYSDKNMLRRARIDGLFGYIVKPFTIETLETTLAVAFYKHDTERKLLEYKRAVESVDDLIIAVDKNYRYLFANTVFLNYHNMNHERIVGQHVHEILGKDVYDKFLKQKFDLCLHDVTVNFEMNMSYPDIGDRNLAVTCNPLKSERGEITGIVALIKDITEQKRVEMKLRKSEERYRLLMENAGIGIGYIDTEGTILLMNNRWREDLQKRADEVIGRPVHEVFGQQWGDIIMERINQAVLSAYPQNYEDKIDLPAGEKWFLTNYSTVSAADSACTEVQIISTDITERKQSKEVIKNVEERYRDIVEDSADFACTLDLKGNFTSVNRAAERLTGFSMAELVGMNFRDYTTKESGKKLFQSFRRLLRTGEPLRDFPCDVIVKDGSVKYFEINATLLKNGDDPIGFQGISRDVTERKFIELQKHVLQNIREKIMNLPQTADIRQVLQIVRDGLENLGVPFRNCGINIIDTAHEPPEIYSYDFVGKRMLTINASETGEKVIVQIWREGKTAYRRDLYTVDTYGELVNIEKLFYDTIRSVIDVPFLQGTLAVSSHKPDAFSDRDIAVLEEMAQILTLYVSKGGRQGNS